jgi:hypothetical protein
LNRVEFFLQEQNRHTVDQIIAKLRRAALESVPGISELQPEAAQATGTDDELPASRTEVSCFACASDDRNSDSVTQTVKMENSGPDRPKTPETQKPLQKQRFTSESDDLKRVSNGIRTRDLRDHNPAL